MEVTLTLSHWLYLFVVLGVVAAMVLKRDVVLPCIVGIFALGLVWNLSLDGATAISGIIGAVQTMFNALLKAGEELFDIMLVIALMVAMLKAMQKMGSDVLMVSPARRLMFNPHVAFFALGLVMYVCALFFWPTPATALVGIMLVPVAISAGLPAMAAAMAVNILGHGMALSGDWVIQGAPGLSERNAGLEPGAILGDAVILSLVAGFVAITVAYLMMRKQIVEQSKLVVKSELVAAAASDVKVTKKNLAFAIIVPATFIVIIFIMILSRYLDFLPHLRGGAATALLGGAATALLIALSIGNDGNKALETSVGHLREGFLFAIKIFAPVIPIAAFFFLGGREAAAILGEGAPRLLFELGTALSNAIPLNNVALSFGNLFVGIITGLDGSGFSGLPLTASLAQSLGSAAGIRVEALAAIGQMGAVWSGGGTLTAWAFGLVATAGIAGVNPMDLARKNFIPVMCGLTAAAIVAIFLM
jgi:hypothetical protein